MSGTLKSTALPNTSQPASVNTPGASATSVSRFIRFPEQGRFMLNILLALITGSSPVLGSPVPPLATTQAETFHLCNVSHAGRCVIDGDTAGNSATSREMVNP